MNHAHRHSSRAQLRSTGRGYHVRSTSLNGAPSSCGAPGWHTASSAMFQEQSVRSASGGSAPLFLVTQNSLRKSLHSGSEMRSAPAEGPGAVYAHAIVLIACTHSTAGQAAQTTKLSGKRALSRTSQHLVLELSRQRLHDILELRPDLEARGHRYSAPLRSTTAQRLSPRRR